MRGQAHTLEAVVAALLVLGGVVFAIQSTAVTPLSASTSNQHIENQQRAQAADLLAVAHENDTLRGAAYAAWNDTYRNAGPPNAFGAALNRTFGDARVAFNVRVTSPEAGRKTLVNQGEPTDNAVATSHPLVLLDDTPYPGFDNVTDASAAGAFNVQDSSTETELFAVMEVHLVVWRI